MPLPSERELSRVRITARKGDGASVTRMVNVKPSAKGKEMQFNSTIKLNLGEANLLFGLIKARMDNLSKAIKDDALTPREKQIARMEYVALEKLAAEF